MKRFVTLLFLLCLVLNKTLWGAGIPEVQKQWRKLWDRLEEKYKRQLLQKVQQLRKAPYTISVDRIYIPYGDWEKVYRQAPPMVALEYEKLLQLFYKLQKRQWRRQQDPPRSAPLVFLNLQGRVEKEAVFWLAEYRLFLRRPQRLQWPLLPRSLWMYLLQSTLNGSLASFKRLGDKVELFLPAGQHLLKLRFATPLVAYEGRDGRRYFFLHFKLPVASQSRFQLHIPGLWTVKMEGGLAKVGYLASPVATRLQGSLDRRGEIKVTYWAREPERKKPVVLADVSEDVLFRAKEIERHATITYTLYRSPVQTLQLEIPQGFLLTQFHSTPPAIWQWKKGKVQLFFPEPVYQKVRCQISLFRPSSDTKPLQLTHWSVGPHQFRGLLSVYADPSLGLTFQSLQGLYPRVSFQKEKKGAQLWSSYEYFGPYRLTLRPYLFSPHVRSQLVLTAHWHENRLITQLQTSFTVTQGSQREFLLRLPAQGLLQKLNITPLADYQIVGRKLIIYPRRPLGQGESLNVHLVWEVTTKERFSLPQFWAPQSHLVIGSLHLRTGPFERLQPLKIQNLSPLSRRKKGYTYSYTFQKPYEGVFLAERKKADVNIRQMAWIYLYTKDYRVKSQLEVSVREAPVSTLEWRLPPAAVSSLQVHTPQGRFQFLPNGLLRLTFRKPYLGQFSLTLEYRLPLPKGKFQPLLPSHPVWVRTQSVLALVKKGGFLLKTDPQKGFELLPTESFSHGGDSPFLVGRFYTDMPPLQLEVEPLPSWATPEGIVSKMEEHFYLGPLGDVVAVARLKVHLSRLGRLTFRLPKGGLLWSVLRDGKGVKCVEAEPQKYALELTKHMADVQITYQLGSFAHLRPKGALILPSLELNLPVVQSTKQLSYTENWVPTGVSTNMVGLVPLPEALGKNLVLWAWEYGLWVLVFLAILGGILWGLGKLWKRLSALAESHPILGGIMDGLLLVAVVALLLLPFSIPEIKRIESSRKPMSLESLRVGGEHDQLAKAPPPVLYDKKLKKGPQVPEEDMAPLESEEEKLERKDLSEFRKVKRFRAKRALARKKVVQQKLIADEDKKKEQGQAPARPRANAPAASQSSPSASPPKDSSSSLSLKTLFPTSARVRGLASLPFPMPSLTNTILFRRTPGTGQLTLYLQTRRSLYLWVAATTLLSFALGMFSFCWRRGKFFLPFLGGVFLLALLLSYGNTPLLILVSNSLFFSCLCLLVIAYLQGMSSSWSPKAKTAALLFCFSLPLLSSSALWATPLKKPPVKESKYVVFIPYDPQKGVPQKVKKVYLPLAQYSALLEQMQQGEVSPLPKVPLLLQGNYRFLASSQQLVGQAHWHFALTKDKEYLFQLPKGLLWQKAKSKDRHLPILQLQGRQFLLLPKGRSLTVVLDFQGRPKKRTVSRHWGGTVVWEGYQFRLPPSASGRGQVESLDPVYDWLPEGVSSWSQGKGREFPCTGGLLSLRRVPKGVPSGEGASTPMQASLAFYWKPPWGLGRLRLHLQRAPSLLALHIPSRYKVLEVRPISGQKGTLPWQRQKERLLITLPKGRAIELEVVLAYSVKADDRLPLPRPLGLLKQPLRLGIFTDDYWNLKVPQQPGLEPLPPTIFSLGFGQRPLRAYQVVGAKYISLKMEQVHLKGVCQVRYSVFVRAKDALVNVQFQLYDLSKQAFSSLQWPTSWKLVQQSQGLKLYHLSPGKGLLFWGLGKRQLRFHLTFMVPYRDRLEIPKLRLSSFQEEQYQLLLYTQKDVQLRQIHLPPHWREGPPLSNMRSWQGVGLWRGSTFTKPFIAEFSREKPEVRARLYLSVAFQGRQAVYRATVAYSIAKAPVTHLDVQVPRKVLASLRSPQLAYRVLSGTSKDVAILRFLFPGTRIGQGSFSFTYRLTTPVTGTFSLVLVSLRESSQPRLIGLELSQSFRLESFRGWQKVSRPTVPLRGNLFLEEEKGGDIVMRRQVAMTVTTLPALVELATIAIGLDPAGRLLYHCTYWVRNQQDQFFQVSLPEKSLVWQVQVEGKGVQGCRKGGVLWIPIPKKTRLHLSFPVTVVFSLDRELPVLTGMSLELPKVVRPEVDATYVALFVPETVQLGILPDTTLEKVHPAFIYGQYSQKLLDRFANLERLFPGGREKAKLLERKLISRARQSLEQAKAWSQRLGKTPPRVYQLLEEIEEKLRFYGSTTGRLSAARGISQEFSVQWMREYLPKSREYHLYGAGEGHRLSVRLYTKRWGRWWHLAVAAVAAALLLCALYLRDLLQLSLHELEVSTFLFRLFLLIVTFFLILWSFHSVYVAFALLLVEGADVAFLLRQRKEKS